MFCFGIVFFFNSCFPFQIRDFVKEIQNELSKPGFNSFGLGDFKAPKVLGDIVESIVGAIFNIASVWKVAFEFKLSRPAIRPMRIMGM